MSEISRRQPLLLRAYESYLGNRDAAGYVRTLSRHYASGTLERLAVHWDCRLRRAAVFSLGFVGGYETNPTVGRALRDVDRNVRLLAGMACHSVWNRAGSMDQRRQLADIIRLNTAGKHGVVVEKASMMLGVAPSFAEVWCQRGSAWFLLDDLSQAIRDLHQALEINPYHFVAAALIGEAYLRLGNLISALEAFRRAVRLNPELEEVRVQVIELARQIEQE
jgi:tetratricopeptide (TPR) repeat protein